MRTDGGYCHYDMVLLPWLAYLRLRRDNYIFHNKTVQAQTANIFGDYTDAAWESRSLGSDAK